MKNLILFILLCMATSCQNIYEKAYEVETLYKAKKESPELVRGSLKNYERKFMSIYESMTRQEQLRYKYYRERANKEKKRDFEAMKRTKQEAISMLNN